MSLLLCVMWFQYYQPQAAVSGFRFQEIKTGTTFAGGSRKTKCMKKTTTLSIFRLYAVMGLP